MLRSVTTQIAEDRDLDYMFATLTIENHGSELVCTTVGVPDDLFKVFTLKRHSTVLDQADATRDSTYSWKVSDIAASGGGDLHVEVAVEETEQRLVTEWQYVASASLKSEFDSWLKSPIRGQAISLPEPSASNGPFETMAFVELNSEQTLSSQVIEDVQALVAATESSTYSVGPNSGRLQRTTLNEAAESGRFMISSACAKELPTVNAWAFGSGYAFDGGVLRRSSEVVHALTLEDDTHRRDSVARFSSQQCGEFIAAVWRNDGLVEFHTDYVGVGAWYEYRTESTAIVSSSFLLAVSLAKAFGEILTLNLDVVDADFTSLTQSFQQPLLDHLAIENFNCVRADTLLMRCPSQGSLAEPTQLGKDLASPDRFTIEKYDELLSQAVVEITENCNALVVDNDVESIRCDISGGLDSRLVLAGLLATGSASADKVSLFTESSGQAPSPEDEEIALLVSAATGVSFSDRPDTAIGPCSVEHRAKKQIEATFGIYWHRGHADSVLWDSSRVQVGGIGLDDIGRDYTTNAWQLSPPPEHMVEDVSVSLAQQVFKWRGRASLKASPRKGVVNIAADWSGLPGDLSEKASQLFNFHRARFHGAGSIPAALGAMRMNPGPCRSLYRLRMMVGGIFTIPRVQLEILHRLNPELAAVPFGSASYNVAYKALYGKARHDLEAPEDQLSESRKRRREGKRTVACGECGITSGNVDCSLVDYAMFALAEIGRDPDLYEIMVPVHRFVRDHLGSTYPLSHSYSRTLINKILHLHAMLRMVSS